MSRHDPLRRPAAAETERRDAWDELLIRRCLQTNERDHPSPDERWRRFSGRVAAYEQLKSIHEAMALRGCEVRRIAVLSRPWPSLLGLLG